MRQQVGIFRKPNARVRGTHGKPNEVMVTTPLPRPLHTALKLRAIETNRTIKATFLAYLEAGLKADRA